MLQRVLNKMPQGKVKKAELKSAQPMKVNLSKIQELEDELSQLSIVSYILEESDFLKCFDEIRNAQSYLDYEYRPDDFEAELDEMIETFNELGVDVPTEVTDIKEQLDFYNSQAEELYDLLDQLKASIGR